MKVNDFIREFGWERVARCTNQSSRDNFFICDGVMIRDNDLDELKRLVKSHELVESHGGLERAKDKEDMANDFGLGHKGLKQAIADVEACHA